MATNHEVILKWIDRGKEKNASYMIVWCDTFDWSDYPGYYDNEEQAQFALDNPDSMQKAMECYDLKKNIGEQLSMSRAWALKRRRW